MIKSGLAQQGWRWKNEGNSNDGDKQSKSPNKRKRGVHFQDENDSQNPNRQEDDEEETAPQLPEVHPKVTANDEILYSVADSAGDQSLLNVRFTKLMQDQNLQFSVIPQRNSNQGINGLAQGLHCVVLERLKAEIFTDLFINDLLDYCSSLGASAAKSMAHIMNTCGMLFFIDLFFVVISVYCCLSIYE